MSNVSSMTLLVDHGAFLAVAVSDGDAVSKALLARSDAGLLVEQVAQPADTSRVLSVDAVGVPPEGCVVRLRLYRRGRSAVVTALGGNEIDLAELSRILDQALTGETLTLPAAAAPSVPQPAAQHRDQAQGSISRDAFDTLMALTDEEPSEALARIVAAVSGLPTQGATTCAAPPSQWPNTPHSIVGSAPQATNAVVSVAVSDSWPSDRSRRELERRAPDRHGQVCSVTAGRGADAVRLVVRTVATVDAAVVLHAVTSTMTRWAAAPETPVAAVDLAAALRRPESGSGPDIEPHGERERLLVDQIRLVLDLPDAQITMRDNFFTLGGDSMSALQLATALGTHGWQVEIKDVFLSPDLRSLATTLVPRTQQQGEVAPLAASGLDQETLARLLEEDQG